MFPLQCVSAVGSGSTLRNGISPTRESTPRIEVATPGESVSIRLRLDRIIRRPGKRVGTGEEERAIWPGFDAGGGVVAKRRLAAA
jgi:hypothetical protein